MRRDLVVPEHLDANRLRGLCEAVRSVTTDSQTSVLLFSGTEETFCLGANFADVEPSTALLYASEFSCLLETIRLSPVATIAVVDGRAVGGGVGLAAACDLVIATDRATFALPEILLGLTPATILPALLERMSQQRIRLRVLQGGSFPATVAASDGLVDEVVPVEKLQQACSAQIRLLSRARRDMVRIWKEQSFDAPAFSRALRAGAVETGRRLADKALGERLRTFQEGGAPPWLV